MHITSITFQGQFYHSYLLVRKLRFRDNILGWLSLQLNQKLLFFKIVPYILLSSNAVQLQ